jgi:hypothetical protein
MEIHLVCALISQSGRDCTSLLSLIGYFAVKRIAVGQSHDYLLETLREVRDHLNSRSFLSLLELNFQVRLLETLRHENIITYHHAWLESYQFSSFGPSVPTL